VPVDHKHDPLQAAIRVANSSKWQRELARNARLKVDDATWSRFTASDAARNCGKLADIANGFKGIQGQAQGVVENFLLRLNGSTAIANKVVARLVAEKTVGLAASSVHFPLIIRSIRVLGVYICTITGRKLQNCRCWQDLCKDELPGAVERILSDALAQIVKKP
jgi:hypothetical protein